ncbi:MAG: OmpH family outer membrane protein [Rhodospirillaceae bacterium]|nr:OmpH family outer membrane protein [Rhodospirillaceae bacterium]
MTKTFQRLIVSAAAAAALLSAPGAAIAQAERHPAPIIGVVDTDLLLRDSLAAKGVRLERDKYAQQYQTQVSDMEQKLRKEDQDLAQQRGVMTPDVFQQRAQEFQKKLADFQTQVRDKQERLEYSFQQSMQEIGNTIMVVSSEVAKEKNVNAVLARSQLMIFDPGMDLTKPVLDKLNQKLPSVQFQNPETLQRLDENGQPIGGQQQSAQPPAAPAKK